jgi:hypothetical protein
MGAPVRVVHDKDPADEIRDDVGRLCAGIKPIAADVLIVMYERTNVKDGQERRSAGGIIVPITANSTASEDKFQGKVGLVMAMGPIAFKADDTHDWGSPNDVPKVGDWVLVNVSQTYSFDLPVYGTEAAKRSGSPDGQRRARLVQDIYVKGIVSPEMFDAIW